MYDSMFPAYHEQQQECNCDLSGSCDNCPYAVFDDVEVSPSAVKDSDELYLHLNKAIQSKWSGEVGVVSVDGYVVGYEYNTDDDTEVEKQSEIFADIKMAEIEFFGSH